MAQARNASALRNNDHSRFTAHVIGDAGKAVWCTPFATIDAHHHSMSTGWQHDACDKFTAFAAESNGLPLVVAPGDFHDIGRASIYAHVQDATPGWKGLNGRFANDAAGCLTPKIECNANARSDKIGLRHT